MMSTPTPTAKLTLEQISADIDQMPSVPDVIMRLSRMLEDPNVTAEELGNVIQLDTKLTAQLLKISNSAYYGLNRKIMSMKEAVAILGMKALKSLIYAILSSKMLMADLQGYGQLDGALWLNALTGATYAKHLAKYYSYPEPDTAFTASILRDLGKIVLNNHVQVGFEAIEAEAMEKRIGFQQAEEAILGFSHMQLGEHIAIKWKFPERLVNTIRYHHTPSDAPKDMSKNDKLLLAIVHLSDGLSMMMGAGVGSDGLMYPMDITYLNECGIETDARSVEALIDFTMDLESEIKILADSIKHK
ncbi:MAG: HDOD domain-containing protein [Candidatus Melainabacteria bacterium]|nr:HDOD domain-containing protein [Candidatus Melainabacteria bacterium]